MYTLDDDCYTLKMHIPNDVFAARLNYSLFSDRDCAEN